MFHSLATSSSQEGYHQHFESAVTVNCKNAGIRWTEAATNMFDWRWICRALRKCGIVPHWATHYNFALIDELYDVIASLFGSQEVKQMLSGWRRTPKLNGPVVQHGFFYSLEVEKELLQESATTLPDPIPLVQTQLPSKKHPNKAEWLQSKLDSPVKLHLKMTDEDVSSILSLAVVDPADQAAGHSTSSASAAPRRLTIKEISTAAFQNGLLMTNKEAEKFEDKVTLQQKALDLLSANGYSNLQSSLRTTLPAQAPAVRASAVQLGNPATAPGLEERLLLLPGPLSSMASSVRQPAVRKRLQLQAPVEEVEGNDADEEQVAAPAEKRARLHRQLTAMRSLRGDPEYKRKEAEKAKVRRDQKKKKLEQSATSGAVDIAATQGGTGSMGTEASATHGDQLNVNSTVAVEAHLDQ